MHKNYFDSVLAEKKICSCLSGFIFLLRQASEEVVFSFSDRLIYRREEGPSSQLCILIMC
jgi:hypothetical protein